MESIYSKDNLQPVIIGGDIGAYSLGLEMFEAYGCTSIAVASSPADVIARSEIFTVEPVPPNIGEDELLAVLHGLAAANPGKTMVALANTDAKAIFLSRNRQLLEPRYLVPYASLESIEQLCDKASFAQLCDSLDIPTPTTVVVDLASTDIPEVPFEFPVVAKAANGEEYDNFSFPGKKKIWFIDTQEQLDDLWVTLKSNGYTGEFLVQETIPGDDSCMRSLTFYVDSNDTVTVSAAAKVLLQDHAPTMIGNPVAMVTEQMPDLWAQAEQILKAGKYQGFANFDIKVDPRNGTPYFFEVNPRIGRNSYYLVAGGVNPLVPMIEDLGQHQKVEPIIATRRALYCVVPIPLIRKYVRDKTSRQEIDGLVRSGNVFNPLKFAGERSLTRKLLLKLQGLNHYRKFRQHFVADPSKVSASEDDNLQ